MQNPCSQRRGKRRRCRRLITLQVLTGAPKPATTSEPTVHRLCTVPPTRSAGSLKMMGCLPTGTEPPPTTFGFRRAVRRRRRQRRPLRLHRQLQEQRRQLRAPTQVRQPQPLLVRRLVRQSQQLQLCRQSALTARLSWLPTEHLEVVFAELQTFHSHRIFHLFQYLTFSRSGCMLQYKQGP